MKTPTKITFDDDGWPIYVPVLKPGDFNESTRDETTAFSRVYDRIFNPPWTTAHAGVEYIICDAMARYAERAPTVGMYEVWNRTWRRLGYTEPGPDIDVEIS